MEKLEFSYFNLYLKKYLKDIGDPRANDNAFINARGDLAAAEAERSRRDGMTVDQAQERAMKVLMQNLDNNEVE